MRVSVSTTELLEAFKRVEPVAGRMTGGLPYTGAVRLDLEDDRLRLTTTDLDLTVSVPVATTGDRGERTVVAPRRRFGALVRATAKAKHGEVVLTFTDPTRPATERTAQAGRITSVTRSDGSGVRFEGVVSAFMEDRDRDDWPPVKPGIVLDERPIPDGMIARMRSMVPIVCHDPSRPVLTGVHVDADGWLVGTDSYRLAVVPQEAVLPGRDMLVPGEAVSFLPVVGTIGITNDGPHPAGTLVARGTEGDWVSTRLIPGEFPNWKQLVPSSYPTEVVVSRGGLLRACEAIVDALGADGDGQPIRLTVTETGVHLWTRHDEDTFEAVVDGDVTNPPSDLVAMTGFFLVDGLRYLTELTIKFEMLDGLKPVKLSDATGAMYLLMPVRMA